MCLEIILQYLIGFSLQYSRKRFISCFVTIRLSIGYKRQSKRCPFAIQKGTFYTSKDALLHRKRASFSIQKGVAWKADGKNPYKRSSSPPSSNTYVQPPSRCFGRHEPSLHQAALSHHCCLHQRILGGYYYLDLRFLQSVGNLEPPPVNLISLRKAPLYFII